MGDIAVLVKRHSGNSPIYLSTPLPSHSGITPFLNSPPCQWTFHAQGRDVHHLSPRRPLSTSQCGYSHSALTLQLVYVRSAVSSRRALLLMFMTRPSQRGTLSINHGGRFPACVLYSSRVRAIGEFDMLGVPGRPLPQDYIEGMLDSQQRCPPVSREGLGGPLYPEFLCLSSSPTHCVRTIFGKLR